MTDLVVPARNRVAELGEMLAEFTAEGGTPHGSGTWNVPQGRLDPSRPRDLDCFVRLTWQLADPATTYLDDTVASHYWWIVDAQPGEGTGSLVGFLAFRHRLNPWLLAEGGHIGYSVRPSRRREGHASAALSLAVRREAPPLGLSRVLVTCDLDNVVSARTIESCGGVLEDERAGKRRYWLDASRGR